MIASCDHVTVTDHLNLLVQSVVGIQVYETRRRSAARRSLFGMRFCARCMYAV